MDLYQLQAQAVPATIQWGPALISALVILEPEVQKVPVWAGTALISFAGLVFMAAVSGPTAEMGRKFQAKLWKKQGGCPTLRMIRHRGPKKHERLRRTVHAHLNKKGEIPTPEEERANPEGADEKWKNHIQNMRNKTVNDRRVQGKNIAYGFVRNLRGGQRITVLTCVGGALAVNVSQGLQEDGGWAVLVTAIVAVWLPTVVCLGRTSRVEEAGEAYAIELFKCATDGS